MSESAGAKSLSDESTGAVGKLYLNVCESLSSVCERNKRTGKAWRRKNGDENKKRIQKLSLKMKMFLNENRRLKRKLESSINESMKDSDEMNEEDKRPETINSVLLQNVSPGAKL